MDILRHEMGAVRPADGLDLVDIHRKGEGMRPSSLFAALMGALVLAAAYFLSARLGLTLAFVNASATAVWPPAGISLAALLVLGYRAWPGIFLGAFLANVTTAGSVAASLGIAAGNTLEGLAGAFLVNRFAGGREAFRRPQNIFKFAVLAGMLSTAVGATIGAISLSLGGLARWSDYGAVWLTWWLGDAGGDLIVAPALLLWSANPRLRWESGRTLEGFFFLLSLILAGAAVFGGLLPPAQANVPLDFLCIPILIWAAFRFGPREAATAALALSAMAIWGTVNGFGPFVRRSQNESLLLLQSFMAVSTMVATAVAAVVSAHASAKEELRGTHEALEQEVRERTLALSNVVYELQNEIAGRKQAEEAVRHKTEELLRSNTELEQFAAIASHELQEPLRKIQTFGEILKALKAAPESEEWQYAQRMEEAAKRMQRLIEDILSLSRVMTNAKPLELVDIGAVLGEVKACFETRLAEAGGEIVLRGALPILMADSLQMSELFENLVSNAYKFRRMDQPLRIEVFCGQPRGGFVEIFVKDNGIGFEEQYLERIFKPFQRLHRRSDYEGSGMGLAICQRILTRHGGWITAKSRLGSGSTFMVTLPV